MLFFMSTIYIYIIVFVNFFFLTFSDINKLSLILEECAEKIARQAKMTMMLCFLCLNLPYIHRFTHKLKVPFAHHLPSFNPHSSNHVSHFPLPSLHLLHHLLPLLSRPFPLLQHNQL